MRKIFSVMTVLMALMLFLTGCGKSAVAVKAELPVTLEQVNTEGKFVARAFLESIFTDDRDMFNKCYPAGYLERLGEASEADVFEEFKKAMTINAQVNGTAYAGSVDCTVANGYDEAAIRSGICFVTGLQYSSVGQIQIQKIRVFFSNGAEKVETDFYFVVYEADGSWYMSENYRGDNKF
ncbi:MAG: hypothetical protein K5779_02010 [Saccharofermentans sp.]|nr:hypothetical protein [Saccharofermentans sp.]